MAYLGQSVAVALPARQAQRYNDEFPANPAIEAGTVRPGIVVGLNSDAETANVVFFHDGPQTHYVQNVPWDALQDPSSVKGSEKEEEQTAEQAPATAKEARQRAWDPAQEGNGTTYEGDGPGAKAAPQPVPQSPEPGSPVAGVPTNPTGGLGSPQAFESGDDWNTGKE